MAISTTSNGRVRESNQDSPPNRNFRDPGAGHYYVLLDTLRSAENQSGGPLKTVGITSSARREGVTTVACNLALHAACQELNTLLVDGNAGHPGLHRNFQLPLAPGLADVCGDSAVQRKTIHDLSARPFKSLPTSLKNSFRRGKGVPRSSRTRENFAAPALKIMTVGDGKFANGEFRRTASEAQQDSEQLLEKIQDSFDLIIVDLPSVSELNSSRFSLTKLDGLIFVLEAEATSDLAAQKSLQQLQLLDANVLGIAFNKYRDRLPRWMEKKLGG